jgi:transcriptional regulator with GAF, ATPase, and Fis domain
MRDEPFAADCFSKRSQLCCKTLGFFGNLRCGAIGPIGANMTEARKFDEALVRFERAIASVEQSAAARRDTVLRLESLEKQAVFLQQERSQLDNDLGRVRAKAAELVDTSKKAAGKIDSAVSRIRAVLYSNSGAA